MKGHLPEKEGVEAANTGGWGSDEPVLREAMSNGVKTETRRTCQNATEGCFYKEDD